MGLFRSADALSIARLSLPAILSCLARWMGFSRSWNRWQHFEELTSLHPDMIATQVLSIALFPYPPSAPTLIVKHPDGEMTSTCPHPNVFVEVDWVSIGLAHGVSHCKCAGKRTHFATSISKGLANGHGAVSHPNCGENLPSWEHQHACNKHF